MIIGLTGYKGSGKDTVAAHLIKAHGFQRIAFVTVMKQSVALLFDIPPWQIESFKNDPSIFVGVGYMNEPEQKFEGQPAKMWSPAVEPISFRNFLQRYGTEAHRAVFGENFWVDRALPRDAIYIHDIVITDVRFHNEANRIRELGGVLVRVTRPDMTSTDTHTSETEMNEILVRFEINNDGTVEELCTKTDTILDEIRRYLNHGA